MKKILMFLVLPILILFTNILKVNATSDYNYDIAYNYNSTYVVNNHNELFFDGTDRVGYLTDMSTALLAQFTNRSWVIAFTKNDIYVISGNSAFRYSMIIGAQSNQQEISIIPVSGSGTGYYWKLSDFANFSNFKSTVLSEGSSHRYTFSTGSRIRIFSGNNGNYQYKDFDYFSNNVNDYIIPFLSNNPIQNTCSGNFCSNSYAIWQQPVVNGITSYIPTYYELFGLKEPSKNMSIEYDYIYSFDLLVDTTYIDTIDFIYTFSVSNIASRNITYELYAVSGTNNLYHYEKLTNQIELQNAPSSLLCSGSSCIYTMSSYNIVFNTLPKGTMLYIKAKLDSPLLVRKNNMTFTYSQWKPNVSWFNNLSPDLLSLTLESSGTNSYMFSNSDSSQNTSFYYSKIVDNDVFYQQPNFVYIPDRRIVESNSKAYLYNTLFNDNEVKFYQLSFSNYQLGGDYALDMSIYSNDLSQIPGASGSFQISFFITPNIYWSNSSIANDRSSVSGCVIDNNTNECIVIEGDFHNQLSEYTSVNNDFKMIDIFNDDMYGLSGIITAPLNYIKELNNYSCSSLTIPFPFSNTNIVIPCLSNYYTSLGNVVDIIHIVMYGIVSWLIAKDLFKTIFNAFKPNKNDIEVVDL